MKRSPTACFLNSSIGMLGAVVIVGSGAFRVAVSSSARLKLTSSAELAKMRPSIFDSCGVCCAAGKVHCETGLPKSMALEWREAS